MVKRPAIHKKLTKKSPAVLLLRSMFENGEITAETDPKSVYESNKKFYSHHHLDPFRTRFNALKKEYLQDSEEKDHEQLDTKCTGQERTLSRKNRKWEDVYTDEDEDSDDDRGDGLSYLLGSHSFKPLHSIAEWEHPSTKTKMISIALLLPSGVGRGDWSVQVENGGQALELTVSWPPPLVDMEVLQRKWLPSRSDREPRNFGNFHPQYLAFEQSLRNMRERMTDCVESKARFLLPFPVETHIHALNVLAFKDTAAKCVYVDLRAFAEDYTIKRNDSEFEVF